MKTLVVIQCSCGLCVWTKKKVFGCLLCVVCDMYLNIFLSYGLMMQLARHFHDARDFGWYSGYSNILVVWSAQKSFLLAVNIYKISCSVVYRITVWSYKFLIRYTVVIVHLLIMDNSCWESHLPKICLIFRNKKKKNTKLRLWSWLHLCLLILKFMSSGSAIFVLHYNHMTI